MKTLTPIHYSDNYLINPTNPILVNLIGAGGTGCHMLTALAKINHSLIALGHAGLQVYLYDDDVVTQANQGRQLFADADKHVIYNSIMRKDRYFDGISDSDIFSEQTLKASGMTYTILFQSPYSEILHFYYGFKPLETGFNLTEGDGKMAPITRDDLAEAEAVILTTDGHENKTYTLTGSESISFKDIAKSWEKIKGQPVAYNVISGQQYVDMLVSAGIPEFIGQFGLRWIDYINAGEYDGSPADIEGLLGRKTRSYHDYLEKNIDTLEIPGV